MMQGLSRESQLYTSAPRASPRTSNGSSPHDHSPDQSLLNKAYANESSRRSLQETSYPSHETYSRPQSTYPRPSVDDSEQDLPALQVTGISQEANRTGDTKEYDPQSYDLVAPSPGEGEGYSLEKRSQILFSREHLQIIFSDPSYLLKFTSFLGVYRPQSVPLLIYYLDALKALRTLHYANAICEGLDPIDSLDYTQQAITLTTNAALEARANKAFDTLVSVELPAFITHQYIQVVSLSIASRISGALAPHLRDASEGLAEVFCLTDPSRADNPIVFASEEFNRTTQYGMSYVLGRNCRFLQGPWTNPSSVHRLRDAITSGRQHQEVFLNYRRDGSPFMNLLMVAPLCDSRGQIRYFIGAQVDVSGLVKECAEMESLQRLLELHAKGEQAPSLHKPNAEKDDELREVAEMLNQGEMETIKKYGGRMHSEAPEVNSESSRGEQQSRLLIRDPNTMTPPTSGMNGTLSGIYENYLLVRPYPALRILFASPSQRVPGILQSPFLNKIGGSNRVREELTAAFADGRGVTAKVRWISKAGEDGRNKWIHCTPLIGGQGHIGVWMVVIVDDERDKMRINGGDGRRWRPAPPVSTMTPPDSRRMSRVGVEGRANPSGTFSNGNVTNGYRGRADGDDGSKGIHNGGKEVDDSAASRSLDSLRIG